MKSFSKFKELWSKMVKARRKSRMMNHILKATRLANPDDPESRIFLLSVYHFRSEFDQFLEAQRQMEQAPDTLHNAIQEAMISNALSYSTLLDKNGKIIIN
jgi:hypothetical protein